MANGSIQLICLCISLILSYCEGIYEPGTRNGVKTGVYTRDPRITSSIQGNYGHQHYNTSGNQYYSRVTAQNEREVPIYNRQQRQHHVQQHRYEEQSQPNADETQNFTNQYFTECPPGVTGQFAYLLNCRQFLNCWKGRGTVQNCPPATAFNAATLECDWPNKVICHGLGSTTRQPRILHSNVARIEEHNRYAPDRVPAGGTHSQAEVKCGPHDMGLFPHPYDCRKFLNCAHGRTFIQSCGPGTGFDPEMKVCDYLKKLNCESDSTIELAEEYDNREDYVPHTHPARIPTGSATHTSTDHLTSQTQHHEVHTHHRYPNSGHQGSSVPIGSGTQHQHREYRPVPNYVVEQQQFEPVYPTRQIQAVQYPQTGPNYEEGHRRERLYPGDTQSAQKPGYVDLPDDPHYSSSHYVPQQVLPPPHVSASYDSETDFSIDLVQHVANKTRGGTVDMYFAEPVENSEDPFGDALESASFTDTKLVGNVGNNVQNYGEFDIDVRLNQEKVPFFPPSQDPISPNIQTSPSKQVPVHVSGSLPADESNLYGGLLPPHPEQFPSRDQVRAMPNKTKVHTYPIYPPINPNPEQFSTDVSNNGQTKIHISSSYSAVSHSRDDRQYQVPIQARFLELSDNHNPVETTTVLSTPERDAFETYMSTSMLNNVQVQTPRPFNRKYYEKGESDDEQKHLEHEDHMIISETLQGLLKPHLNENDDGKKESEHVMKIPRRSGDRNDGDEQVAPRNDDTSFSAAMSQYIATSVLNEASTETPRSFSQTNDNTLAETRNESDISENHELAISEALKLLLRPHLSKSDKPTNEDVHKANENLMNKLKVNAESNHNTLDDAELITAGEQDSLNAHLNKSEATVIQDEESITHDRDITSRGAFPSNPHSHDHQKPIHVSGVDHPKNEVEMIPGNRQTEPTSVPRVHSHREFHEAHPLIHNPFTGTQGSVAVPQPTPHYHHNHHHHHRGFPRGHSREYHDKHPHLPNPFSVTVEPPTETIVNQHRFHRGHSKEFHDKHPYVPNPFKESPDVPKQTPPEHRHRPGFHSREYHKKHPHIPNPFENTENSPNQSDSEPKRFPSTTRPIVLSIYPTLPPKQTNTSRQFSIDPRIDQEKEFNPRIELLATTPRTSNKPSVDHRRGGVETFDDQQTNISGYGSVCEFNCGNGKCVKTTEICDGVNDCGNRLDEKSCDHIGFQIRLSGEEGHSHMGRLEVKAYGKWGYVCDDKFGMRDANVACKELGFPLGASEVRANSYYMPHTAMKDERNQVLFMMDEVDCTGNETSLRECDFKGWGVHDCSVDELVGVVCKIPVMKCPHDYWMCSSSQMCIPPAFVCDNVPDCSDKSDESPAICNASIEYRLAQGGNSLEGRVEVKYRGIWGTVCDDDFGETEAQIVCNSLGYYGKATSLKNAFGPGAGPIWLDQVACDGSESSLDKCSHFSWGEHNCNHTEDASIRCTIGAPRTSNIIQAKNQEFQIINEPNYWDENDVYLYQVERSSKNLPLTQQLCGQISRNLANETNNNMYMARVISGKSVQRGHHPWQATIRAKGRAGKSTHWCGAALISRWHLLTAAHCLVGFPKGAYLVRLGDHYADIVEPSEIEVFIENWYIHEDFRKGQHMNNDIAVIVLKNPVPFSDYIWPICLPDKTANYDTGRKCTISGWGSIQSGVSTPSNDLRAAKIPILSQDICKRPYVYGDAITEGMFCAGSLDEGADACDGDSGGPFSCTDGEQETLYGIISWGQHCGYVNKPGVYVNVTHYLDWITEQMSKFRKPRSD